MTADGLLCAKALAALPDSVRVIRVSEFSPGVEPEVELDPAGWEEIEDLLPQAGTVYAMMDEDKALAIHFRHDGMWYSLMEKIELPPDAAEREAEAKFLQQQESSDRIVQIMLKHASPEAREAYELYAQDSALLEDRVFEECEQLVDSKNLQESAYGIVHKARLLTALRKGNVAQYIFPDRWQTLREIEERVCERLRDIVEKNREHSLNELMAGLGDWLAERGDPPVKRPILKMYMDERGFRGNQTDLDELRARHEVYLRAAGNV